jgi:beta-glucanase (GH16 family)
MRDRPASALLVLAAAALLSASCGPREAAHPLTLVWSEEFETSGLPDPLVWGYEAGMIRNQEAQYYTAGRTENARIENGCLVIEARKEDYAAAHYTSASVNTLGKREFFRGRIEVRAKIPTGRGSGRPSG